MSGGPTEGVSHDEALDGFYAALLDDDPVQLYERAPCGYLSTTPDGTIVKVNQTFLSLTGYQRGDLVGRRTFSELLTMGGRIYHETHYAPMLRMQGTAREIALEIVTPSGGRLPVLVNSVIEPGPDGKPLVIRTAVFDATDRRSYERELLRAKQRAEESEQRARVLALTLQQSLMPPAPPAIPGLDVSAVYRPVGEGAEVGGDFYDVFERAPDDWLVAVGDVRGKGVGAAVVTALVRYTIRGMAVRSGSPAQVLRAVNEVLLLDPTDRFCTVALARLRPVGDGWHLTAASAGHPLPLLAGPAGPAVPVGRHGTLLGIFPDAQVHEVGAELSSGSTVVLYTDGASEARGPDGFYGEDRLRESVTRHRAAEDVAVAVAGDVLAFQSGPSRDDLAVVAARVS